MSRYGTLPGGRTLFVDLDGVLADFDGGFESLFRMTPHECCEVYGRSEMWRLIDSRGTFFQDLPEFEGTHRFYRQISYQHPIILTACPSSNYESVATQKRNWVRSQFGLEVAVLPVPDAKSKPYFMHRPGDILIDDYPKNIERWEAAGGVGILHEGDFNETLRRLNDSIHYIWPTNRSASGTSRAPSVVPQTTSPDTTTGTLTASPQAAATVNLPEEKPLRVTPAGTEEASPQPWNCS